MKENKLDREVAFGMYIAAIDTYRKEGELDPSEVSVYKKLPFPELIEKMVNYYPIDKIIMEKLELFDLLKLSPEEVGKLSIVEQLRYYQYMYEEAVIKINQLIDAQENSNKEEKQ